MTNRALVCRSCSQPLPADSTLCPRCDDTRSDETADADENYNRTVNLFMRVTCGIAAAVAVFTVRATGRSLLMTDYILMMAVAGVSAATIWGFLRWLYPHSKRYLWRTAMIPSFVIVALVFACRATGTTAPATAAAAPAKMPIARAPVAIQATEVLLPLVRMANESFTKIEGHAKTAGNETTMANLPAAFTLKPATPAALKADRARLKKLDARLLEIDAEIRNTAAGLALKVNAFDAPTRVKTTVLRAIRESGTELVKGCRESVAQQRQVVEKADLVLAYMEPRFKRFSAKTKQVVFTTKADQAVFDKLVKQYDACEEEATATLRRIHSRSDQSKQQLLVALTRPRD